MLLSNHLILCRPFSSCPQSFPASGSFPMSRLFTSGGQSIGASASATVLPMNIQSWFPLPSEPFLSVQFSSVVCECSVMSNSLWPYGLQQPVLHSLPEFAQTRVHWVSDAIQPSHPLLLPSLFALSLSQNQGLSNELTLRIRWWKYWSFSFSNSPSNEYSRLISFRID